MGRVGGIAGMWWMGLLMSFVYSRTCLGRESGNVTLIHLVADCSTMNTSQRAHEVKFLVCCKYFDDEWKECI